MGEVPTWKAFEFEFDAEFDTEPLRTDVVTDATPSTRSTAHSFAVDIVAVWLALAALGQVIHVAQWPLYVLGTRVTGGFGICCVGTSRTSRWKLTWFLFASKPKIWLVSRPLAVVKTRVRLPLPS